MRQQLRKILPVSFHTWWLYRRYRDLLYFKLFIRYFLLRQTPVVVFTIGKVGSLSVYSALKDHAFAFHLHLLSARGLQYRQSLVDDGTPYEPWDLRAARWLQRYVIQPGRPIKIITLMRDPIATRISAFFHNLNEQLEDPTDIKGLSLDDLFERYREEYGSLRYYSDWYEIEFSEALGIDIFEYPFDRNKGYGIIKNENIDILLLTLESPQSVREMAICGFLDMQDVELDTVNVASTKIYGEKYKKFKKQINISAKVLDANYESRTVRHFYKQDKIAQLRKQWEHSSTLE